MINSRSPSFIQPPHVVNVRQHKVKLTRWLKKPLATWISAVALPLRPFFQSSITLKSDHQPNIILAFWKHGKTEIDIPKQQYDIVYEKVEKKLNEAFQPATATK